MQANAKTGLPAMAEQRRWRREGNATVPAPLRQQRCELVGKGARIVDASLIDMADGAAPSVQQGVLSVHGGRVFAGCADGAFEVLSVKPDGNRSKQSVF